MIIKINADADFMPTYATKWSAGLDLKAHIDKPVLLAPRHRMLIPTGVIMELPEGYEAQIRPRSGLAFKHGVTVLNSPGTIDADYRGEIQVLLINHGTTVFTINRGDRIAQMVISPVTKAACEFYDPLSDFVSSSTERGSGGFGSTGV